MFKALLKTIPSLSGNMKLSCFLDDYRKNKNEYYCSIKTAKLIPLSHTLYDKNISINLKNNSYEYDVKKFFEHYFNIFYSTYNDFSKINIPILDITNDINDNNSDFLYGCKRISYKKYDNQLAFFAPIYVESINDIKNKYFKIQLEFNKSYRLKKEIIISLYDSNNENYLADYLKRYTEKIDDNVIFMSKDYKNIYYGIDVLHGGFIYTEDNISSNLYKKYYTMNDFDAILNFGFKRNSIIMKQIIPLCFYFDPIKTLSFYEQQLFKDAEIIISGQWYTKNNNEFIEEDFYNFSDNYNNYYESIYQLTKQNEFIFIKNSNNIMNMSYPAFKEASSENYKYVNTINKNYNRWKLKYSSDNYPYIINNNFAFSNNQNSLSNYKEFPVLYKQLTGVCKLYNGNYNLLFDLDDIYDSKYKIINNKNAYYDLYNKNFISNFYNLITKNKDNTYDDIFTNSEYWINVNKDNKVYYKGILYDLNILYSKYKDMSDIDYFSVFINPELQSCISNKDYNNTYNSVKYLLNYNDEQITYLYNNCNKNIDNINQNIYSYQFITDNFTYILNNKTVYNDKIVVDDKNGNYVDINRYYFDYKDKYGEDKSNNVHYNKIKYIDINELILYGFLYTDLYQNLYEKIYGNNLNIIEGYKIIDINYKNNIISSMYSKVLELYKISHKYNNGIIYTEHKFLENEDIYWVYNNLYFSIYPNKIKYKLLENINLLDKYADDHKITIYFKTEFILESELKNSWFNKNTALNEEEENEFNDLFHQIDKYYIINGLYDKANNLLYTDICFKLIDKLSDDYGKYCKYKLQPSESNPKYLENFNENVIFIDPYNLSKFYKNLFMKDLTNYYKVENCYCNFLNIDHVVKYFEKLNKDENLNQNGNILDTIYIKIHLFNNYVNDVYNKNSINFINTTTEYIKITDLLVFDDSELPLNIIIKYINYDDNGYFFFNNIYFTDGIYENINNKTYPIKNFELCFKKDMIILNTSLYNLIMEFNNNHIYKDLYLYRIYNNSDYKFEFIYNNINARGEQNDEDNRNKLDSIKLKNENIELYPYFNSIYTEEKINTKIYSDYFLNNIIKCDNIDFYKYNIYSIDYLLYFPKSLETEDMKLCQYRYSLYNKYNNYIINSKVFKEKYFNNSNVNDNQFKDYGNMITYTFNNTTYGFYILHTEFDNTRNTLNIMNDNYNNINVVTYFNNISVDKYFNDQTTYLSTYYHNLIPYINNSNIIKDFMNNVDIIIKPNKYTLENIYYQYPNKDILNHIYSYNIVINRSKTNIQLIRYFDNIVPYINKSNNNITAYYQYYKTSDKYIEYNLNIKNISYIMYQQSNTIYNPKNILYFTNNSYIPNKIEPIEYKNYNHNKFFNLEKEIEIKYNSNNSEYNNLFSKQDLEKIENDKTLIYNIFKEYLLNENKLLTENDILFLYKKYDVKFSHTIKSFYKNEITNKRLFDLYSLTIKYTLY